MLTHGRPEPTSPERVVVLGARGFLARVLNAELANRGVPAAALGSADVDLTHPAAADTLAGRLRATDALVFLAALTPDRGRGIDTLMANLRMADTVCRALQATTVAHVVYISSDAVYREQDAFVTEDSRADALSLYGSMHALRERMLHHQLGASVPLAVLRPTLVFGAGDTHNSYGPNRFMRAAARERAVSIFGAGEEQRDHVFVGDVARLIAEVLVHRSAGVLNVVTGTSIAFGDLARQIAALAGEDVRVVSLPRAAGPVLHRHYDPASLHRAFPAFRFTPRAAALRQAWSGYVAAG
jgi:nucleoside-diphosphate-sugar epimerase